MDSTQTDVIDIAPPGTAGVVNLELAMGAGRLTLNPGEGDKLVQGTITYNVPELKPIVTTSGDTVRIEQNKSGYTATRGKVENVWDLKLGPTPMALSLSIGAANVRLELGGLSLASINITHGATDLTMTVSQPNQIELDALRFTAGAAKSTLQGLANLNANSLQFKSGAGTLALDFDGRLQRDLAVNVSASAGSVVVAMPQGVSAAATISGVMTTVSTHGAWTKAQRQYVTPGTGSKITLDFKMSVGNLELRSL